MAMSMRRPYHYERRTTIAGTLVRVPPLNQRRRDDLADAAIALLAEGGVHGVTHRTVERRAGLPTGTASNYFRSREALLVAVAERVGQLHYGDMDAIASGPPASRSPGGRGSGRSGDVRERATDLIAESLLRAATTDRARYLAIFELQMESLRRPALADALADLQRRSVAFTTGHHAAHGLDIAPEAVPTMVGLFGGALFTLVTSPPGTATPAVTRDLAAAIVRAALGDA
jgi:AcrR family transcriptional regulator